MQKIIRLELTEADIDRAIKTLEENEKIMYDIAKAVVKDASEYGLKQMKLNYKNSGTKPSTDLRFAIAGNDYEKSIGMTGPQAIYEEFGTGTMGAQQPHPLKNNFNLNPYNSGKTIRENKSGNSEASFRLIPEGGLYWTYYDESGTKQYTQGIAAQKEVYDSMMATIKKTPSIIKKRTREMLFKGD